MKFKNLFAAALMVSASAAAFAQQDTKPATQQPQSQSQQPQSNEQPSTQFNVKEYSEVQSSDVPASLRTTLQEEQYKGWESGQLYRQNNGQC
jgi:hypothetical protein